MNRLTLWLGVGLICAASYLGAAGPLAIFRTPLGELEVELFDADKPATVRNFIRYVNAGAYTNMFFHRWLPGFVVQGGGFYVATQSKSNVIAAVPVFEVITNEYSVGRTYSNLYGTLAMARVGGQTNSASSQWYFNLANNTGLDAVDGGFTVFGRVLRGTNVLNRFNNVFPANGIYRLALGDPLNDLPVLSPTPGFNDLVYADISILAVQLHADDSGRWEILWNSVSNRLNHVEVTTTMPPTWRILASTNGTGGLLRIWDAAAGDRFRAYRIRVDF